MESKVRNRIITLLNSSDSEIVSLGKQLLVNSFPTNFDRYEIAIQVKFFTLADIPNFFHDWNTVLEEHSKIKRNELGEDSRDVGVS